MSLRCPVCDVMVYGYSTPSNWQATPFERLVLHMAREHMKNDATSDYRDPFICFCGQEFFDSLEGFWNLNNHLAEVTYDGLRQHIMLGAMSR